MNKQLKIALLGLGTVGSGVPRILEDHKEKITQVTGTEISVKKALVRDDIEKAQRSAQYDFELTTEVAEILEDAEIEVVVELMGKVEPARTYIKRALEKGKHVVTANKDLLAQYGNELVTIAQKNHCDLYYEASVAGGIPILRTIANSLAADNIQRVLGIVNGTTNYMLTKMVMENKTYSAALQEAQELGFAESDPTNDVDGIDAAFKMVILTQFAFGMNITLKEVETKGIRGLDLADIAMAHQLGYVIKLIGSAEIKDGSVSVEVGPMLVPQNHPLAAVHNEFNAVFINSSGVGESMYYGPGAGAMPTATSVVSDLITIAKNLRLGTSGHMFNAYKHKTRLTPDADVESQYYFSIEVPDKVGQFRKLTEIITAEGISFDQLVQEQAADERARIVVISHKMTKAQKKHIEAAINQLEDFTLLASFRVLEA